MTRARLLLLVIALFLLPAALSAQDDIDLSESISVSAGGLTLSADYPDGWFTQVQSFGAIYIASSQEALETSVSGGTDFARGDVAVSIISPALLESLSLDTTGDAVDVLSRTVEATMPGVDAEVSPFDAFGTPGAIAQIVSETPPIDALFIAFEFAPGVVIAAIQPSDPETTGASQETQDLVEAIMRSVSLTLESAQTNGTEGDAERLSIDVEQPNGTFEFSIALPEGWVSDFQDDNGAVYIASSEDTLELVTGAVDPGAEFEDGEAAISIALPVILEQLGVDMDADPLDAIDAFVELVSGEMSGDPQSAESAQGIPVSVVGVTADGLPGGSAVVAAAAFDAGTILVVVTPIEAFDDSIADILDTIQFGGQGAPVEVDEPDNVEPIRQWASDADGSSEYGSNSWSFEQATGEPDTDTCGDQGTAWAGASSTSREILRVSFETPVIPTEVNIYQTYNPGAIVQIDVANSDNPDLVLPIEDSADEPGNTKCPGVFTLDLSDVDEPIDMVVIYLDQELTGNWNEIDAVELVGVPAE